MRFIATKIKTLPISMGGTGGTSALAARTNLGIKYAGIAASARGTASSLSLAANEIKQITLNTWVTRTDTAFAFSGGGIKCPYTGTVLISGSAYVDTSMRAGCYLYKGSTEITSQYRTQGGVSTVTSGAIIIPVTAGDVIYLKARASGAASTVPNHTGTHLDIMYIR